MNTERIRRGGVFLCVAAACGVLFLALGDGLVSSVFQVVALIAALCGLAEIASGLNAKAEEPKD